MSDKQKQTIAIAVAALALCFLGFEFYNQWQSNKPRGLLAPKGAMSEKAMWLQQQKGGAGPGTSVAGGQGGPDTKAGGTSPGGQQMPPP